MIFSCIRKSGVSTTINNTTYVEVGVVVPFDRLVGDNALEEVVEGVGSSYHGQVVVQTVFVVEVL